MNSQINKINKFGDFVIQHAMYVCHVCTTGISASTKSKEGGVKKNQATLTLLEINCKPSFWSSQIETWTMTICREKVSAWNDRNISSALTILHCRRSTWHAHTYVLLPLFFFSLLLFALWSLFIHAPVRWLACARRHVSVAVVSLLFAFFCAFFAFLFCCFPLLCDGAYHRQESKRRRGLKQKERKKSIIHRVCACGIHGLTTKKKEGDKRRFQTSRFFLFLKASCLLEGAYCWRLQCSNSLWRCCSSCLKSGSTGQSSHHAYRLTWPFRSRSCCFCRVGPRRKPGFARCRSLLHLLYFS